MYSAGTAQRSEVFRFYSRRLLMNSAYCGLLYEDDPKKFFDDCQPATHESFCEGTPQGVIMQALGKHLIVELYQCDPEILNQVELIREHMLEATRATRATIVGESFQRFHPHGVSGAVIIAESHLTIHTWPEYGYAAVDFFTCGEDTDPWRAMDYLKNALSAGAEYIRELARGLPDDFQVNTAHPLVKPPRSTI